MNCYDSELCNEANLSRQDSGVSTRSGNGANSLPSEHGSLYPDSITNVSPSQSIENVTSQTKNQLNVVSASSGYDSLSANLASSNANDTMATVAVLELDLTDAQAKNLAGEKKQVYECEICSQKFDEKMEFDEHDKIHKSDTRLLKHKRESIQLNYSGHRLLSNEILAANLCASHPNELAAKVAAFCAHLDSGEPFQCNVPVDTSTPCVTVDSTNRHPQTSGLKRERQTDENVATGESSRKLRKLDDVKQRSCKRL